MVLRGGGYVPAPTDPAYYDMLAGGETEGIVEGISDVAKGAFGYVQGKNEKEEKKKIAQQLLQSFLEEGVPEQQAKTAVLEYVTKGTQELMKAFDNRRVLAAQLKQAEAQTAKTVEETQQIAPNAEAGRGLVGAQTELAGEQASDIPVRTGILGEDTRSDNARANRELDARIEESTRKFVQDADTDENGVFSRAERTALIQKFQSKALLEWQKAQKASGSEKNSNPEMLRLSKLTKEQVRQEALDQAKQEMENYEFAMNHADDVLPGVGEGEPGGAGGGKYQASTYEEAVAKIKQTITDPTQMGLAISKAKSHFGVR